MRLKLLSTAAAATLFAAGAAFAQETSSTGNTGNNAPDWVSEKEASMYEENDFLADFFTDETMTEMRSEEEMMAAWEGMDEDDQASVMSFCDEAMQDQDNYSDTTKGICGMVSGGR